MIRVTVSQDTITKSGAIVRKLRLFSTRMHDRSTLMEEVKRTQAKRWARNFASEGREYGGWVGLSPRTIQDRAASGYGPGPILRRTGGLYNYVHTESHNGQVDASSVNWHFSNAGGTSGVTGANWPLSHHFGTSGKWSVPARPIWQFDAKDRRRLRLTTQRWVRHLMESIFGG